MRRFLSLTSVCTLVVFAGFAHAQHIDIAGGGSRTYSSKPTSASEAFQPPEESSGTLASVNAQMIFKNRFGIGAEVAIQPKQGLYDGYQRFRPALYDVNAVFAPRISPKISADLMAGVGGQSLIFYNQFAPCPSTTTCRVSLNSNHLLLHAGGGVRYYFLGHFFVRPEVHYYFVNHNVEFHSRNLFRLGASIGYTFGPK